MQLILKKAMSTVQLENKILVILKSSGLKKEEMLEVLQNLNNQLQNSEDDDFFLRLKNGFGVQTLNSSSKWLSSEEIDSYL